MRVCLAKAPSLGTVGSAAWLTVTERDLRLIVVRSGRHTFYALSRICTHGAQVVSFVSKRRVIMCNNHNHSVFGLDGRVIKGPAPTPLASYPVHLRAGWLEIEISRGDGV